MDDLIELINDDWEDKNRQKADADFWKDIDSHPAFVTELDSNPGNVSSGIEAIQALKFDSDCSEANVMSYKNEGNYYYRKKTYTLAIVNYTKGLKLNADDNEMNCILYTNRAACHFHQENYRKCIKDCIAAIKMNPIYIKAYWRAANAAAKIDKCDEVLEYCLKGLAVCPDNSDLLALQQQFVERKASREARAGTQLQSRQSMLLEQELRRRGVTIAEDVAAVEIPMQHAAPASIDGAGLAHLNVLILYPEYGQTDFLQDVLETATVLDCLQSVFSPREPSVSWDTEGHYTLYTAQLQPALHAFYENRDEEMVRFNTRSSLRDLIAMKQFRLRSDFVVEINVVSVLSDKFLRSWRQITSPSDLD